MEKNTGNKNMKGDEEGIFRGVWGRIREGTEGKKRSKKYQKRKGNTGQEFEKRLRG